MNNRIMIKLSVSDDCISLRTFSRGYQSPQRFILTEKELLELEEKGYQIRRNGVSNYTLDKKSRVVFIGKIPDHTDDIKSTKDIPSWKRMCYCILKNDHTCRFMGFGLTRQELKRVEVIKKKYGGMLLDK
mgnify:CR=1 FL=1